MPCWRTSARAPTRSSGGCRVEELAGRVEDVALQKPQRAEGYSESELRLQETVSGLAKRVQEIVAKVDAKPDAMDAASMDQRARPSTGRLDPWSATSQASAVPRKGAAGGLQQRFFNWNR